MSYNMTDSASAEGKYAKIKRSPVEYGRKISDNETDSTKIEGKSARAE
jgi:hypothetical protein